jgi:hypothetical protein
MSIRAGSFEAARKVADAVLFEGYVLYPYRASSAKNQVRWQFGVVAPRSWSEAGGPEPWYQQTQVLLDPGDGDPALHVKLRCLQVQARTVERADGDTFTSVPELEVGGKLLVTWEEGVEREVDAVVFTGRPVETALPFQLPSGEEVEHVRGPDGRVAARLVRRRRAVDGVLRVTVARPEGPYQPVTVTVRIENVTRYEGSPDDRDGAVRRSLVAAHTLLAVTGADFISLLEPPEWARPAASGCENIHTWPVLVGDLGRRDTMLSSPIILYDHPVIAPESDGDFFDSTEIDELLTLRTMTLTEAEKREARSTDDRAAAIIDRVDAMPPELLDKLHGAIRYLRGVETGAAPDPLEDVPPEDVPPEDVPPEDVPPEDVPPEDVPWWNPAVDASVSPDTDSVRIGAVEVARGSRVRLRPGRHGTDAHDMFVDGRAATVEAVVRDVDDRVHIAVILDGDPDADLARWHGRFMYFAPEEVEPL